MTTNNTFIQKTRNTKETSITIELQCHVQGNLDIVTPVPFFTHMLTALLFHGNFSGKIDARGDTDVDDHHLIEDVGIVLGEILAQYAFDNQPITRFGYAKIPMDDALGECIIDFSNRAFLHYDVYLPQTHIKTFDTSLAREFFTSLTHNARINLHLISTYGVNSHHILEALFKACGRALQNALTPIKNNIQNIVQSTKGSL